METSYSILKDEAIKSAELRGHKLEWNEDRSSSIWSCNPTSGMASCIYCKMKVYVDQHPRPNSIDIAGEAVAMNCKFKDSTKNENGLAVTTYIRGYGQPVKPKSKKSKKFAPLRKFAKNAKQAKYAPVLGCVWVRVVENTMVCLMTDLEVVKQATIQNVIGACIDICVHRDAFVDTLNLLDTDKFVLIQDDKKMILEIHGENFVTRIKGMNSDEFPREKLEVVYLN